MPLPILPPRVRNTFEVNSLMRCRAAAELSRIDFTAFPCSVCLGMEVKELVAEFVFGAARLRCELAEESRLLLLQTVGALASGEHGRVEGEINRKLVGVWKELLDTSGHEADVTPTSPAGNQIAKRHAR